MKSPKGVDEIRAWYERQSSGVKAKFLSRLTTLVQLDVKDWNVPLFRWLRGDGAPLGEVRFEVQRVQHRPLGFRVGERVFTLTFCATEKGNKFVPLNACQIALERKAEIDNDQRRSIICWLRLQ